MPEGAWSDGTPWTFAEGRVCPGPTDDIPCGKPLPDVEDRPGWPSPRCPECRHIRRDKLSGDRDTRRAAQKIGRPTVEHALKGDFGHAQTAAERAHKADYWKAALIEGVTNGNSVKETLERLNIKHRAYERQRDRDHAFRANMDHARLLGRSVQTGAAIPTDLPFGEFAQKFFHRTHYPHQLLIADTIDHLDARDVVMILMAPESGKTATLEDYVCRQLAIDPTHRFRIISEAADLSTRIVGAISRRFTDTEIYPDFIARYGPFYEKGQERSAGKPWTQSQLTVWKNPGTERDRNVVAQSWSGSNYGSRIDTLIIDDVISQKTVGQSKEIFERIRGTFFNRGVSMRTIIIGTRIGVGDIYDMFEDAGLVTRNLPVPAVGGLGAQPGEPTTPGMWEYKLKHRKNSACCPPGIERECPDNGEWLTPREFLELIRFQSSEETWWASYMQNPRSDAVSTFGANLDDCKDLTRICGKVEGGMNVLTIDPALGGGTAVTVQNHTYDRLTILDAHSATGLAKTEQQLEIIETYATRYRPGIVIVEYDAQQKGLGNDDRLRAMSTRLGFQIVPHITRGQKVDVPYAVASMNQSFIKKEISIPWGDPDTRRKMELLVQQLRGWRIPEQGKRDRQIQDLVMALWFGWKHWMVTRSAPDKTYARAKRPSWLGPDMRRSLMSTGRH